MAEAAVVLKVGVSSGSALCTVKADTMWKSVEVKLAVERETGIPHKEQRLHLRPSGAELRDQQILAGFLSPGDTSDVLLLRRSAQQAQWLERVEQHGLQLRLAPPEIQADRDVAEAAVRRNWRALEFVSAELKKERELLLIALDQDARALKWAAETLWADRTFVLRATEFDPFLVDKASDELRADRGLMISIVQKDWRAFECASTELRSDREVVLAAVTQDIRTLDALPPAAVPSVFADREIMCVAVKKDWRVLAKAHETLRADRELALAAVSQDWRALGHVAPDLRTDCELLMVAMEQDWFVISCALEEVPLDREVLLSMLKLSWHVLVYLPDIYKEDPEFAREAVSQTWEAYQYLPEARRADKDLAMVAVSSHGPTLLQTPEVLRADREIALAAVKSCGLMLEHCSVKIQDDLEVVEAATTQDWRAIAFATEKMRRRQEVVFAGLSQDLLTLEHASPFFLKDHHCMVEAVSRNWLAINYADKGLLPNVAFVKGVANLKPDLEVYMTMVERNWECLRRLPEDIQSTRAIVLAAVKCSWRALPSLDADRLKQDVLERLWTDEEIIGIAVRQDYKILFQAAKFIQDYAIEKIWCRKSVAMALIAHDATLKLLEGAPPKAHKAIWGDVDIACAAVERNSEEAISKVLRHVWADERFVQTAVRTNWRNLLEAPPSIQRANWADKDIVTIAVKQDWHAIEKVAEDLKGDRDLVLLAVQSDWHALEKIPKRIAKNFWLDKEIVLVAMQQDWKSFLHAGTQLQEDKEMAWEAVKLDWHILECLPKLISRQHWADPDIVLTAVEQDWRAIEQAGPMPRRSAEVLEAAVKQSGTALKFAADTLLGDPAVAYPLVMAAVQQDGLAIQYAPASLKKDRKLAEMAVRQNLEAYALLPEEVQRVPYMMELIKRPSSRASSSTGSRRAVTPLDRQRLATPVTAAA